LCSPFTITTIQITSFIRCHSIHWYSILRYLFYRYDVATFILHSPPPFTVTLPFWFRSTVWVLPLFVTTQLHHNSGHLPCDLFRAVSPHTYFYRFLTFLHAVTAHPIPHTWNTLPRMQSYRSFTVRSFLIACLILNLHHVTVYVTTRFHRFVVLPPTVTCLIYIPFYVILRFIHVPTLFCRSILLLGHSACYRFHSVLPVFRCSLFVDCDFLPVVIFCLVVYVRLRYHRSFYFISPRSLHIYTPARYDSTLGDVIRLLLRYAILLLLHFLQRFTDDTLLRSERVTTILPVFYTLRSYHRFCDTFLRSPRFWFRFTRFFRLGAVLRFTPFLSSYLLFVWSSITDVLFSVVPCSPIYYSFVCSFIVGIDRWYLCYRICSVPHYILMPDTFPVLPFLSPFWWASLPRSTIIALVTTTTIFWIRYVCLHLSVRSISVLISELQFSFLFVILPCHRLHIHSLPTFTLGTLRFHRSDCRFRFHTTVLTHSTFTTFYRIRYAISPRTTVWHGHVRFGVHIHRTITGVRIHFRFHYDFVTVYPYLGRFLFTLPVPRSTCTCCSYLQHWCVFFWIRYTHTTPFPLPFVFLPACVAVYFSLCVYTATTILGTLSHTRWATCSLRYRYRCWFRTGVFTRCCSLHLFVTGALKFVPYIPTTQSHSYIPSTPFLHIWFHSLHHHLFITPIVPGHLQVPGGVALRFWYFLVAVSFPVPHFTFLMVWMLSDYADVVFVHYTCTLPAPHYWVLRFLRYRCSRLRFSHRSGTTTHHHIPHSTYSLLRWNRCPWYKNSRHIRFLVYYHDSLHWVISSLPFIPDFVERLPVVHRLWFVTPPALRSCWLPLRCRSTTVLVDYLWCLHRSDYCTPLHAVVLRYFVVTAFHTPHRSFVLRYHHLPRFLFTLRFPPLSRSRFDIHLPFSLPALRFPATFMHRLRCYRSAFRYRFRVSHCVSATLPFHVLLLPIHFLSLPLPGEFSAVLTAFIPFEIPCHLYRFYAVLLRSTVSLRCTSLPPYTPGLNHKLVHCDSLRSRNTTTISHLHTWLLFYTLLPLLFPLPRLTFRSRILTPLPPRFDFPVPLGCCSTLFPYRYHVLPPLPLPV